MMKTAICFTGTARSLQHTHQNIQEFLIDPSGDYDIFAHLSPSPYVNNIHEYFNFTNIAAVALEPDQKFNTTGLSWFPGWPAGRHSGPNPQQTYLNMLHSRKRCGELLAKYVKKYGVAYDRVIFSRLDVEYFNHLPVVDLSCMGIPDFHNFSHLQGTGCNDRFAISNFENMQIYFNLFDNIEKFIQAGGLLHAESFLGWHLASSGVEIKKYPIRFGRIRPDGSRQDERLREADLAPADY